LKRLKHILLITSMVLFAGFFVASIGATSSDFESKAFKVTEADYEAITKKIFKNEDLQVVEKPKACCKIYNSKFQLVYMSRDKEDAHMKQLKLHCDLIMKTDSSSYYLLVD